MVGLRTLRTGHGVHALQCRAGRNSTLGRKYYHGTQILLWGAGITMGRRYYHGTVQTYQTHMLRPGGGNCVWTARFFPDEVPTIIFLKLLPPVR